MVKVSTKKKKITSVMLLNFVISILLLKLASSSNTTNFIFNKFNPTDLTLYGLSEITDSGLLQLTNNTILQSGLAFYPHPIQFKRKSFHTTFIFAIVPEYPNISNHGMTFLISSTKEITGTPGPFFGIFNETNKFNSSNLLAIEMDTSMTIGFKDIDNNHIGIDVNSIRSVNSSSAAYIDANKEYKSMNLPSGDSMQVWIDCSGTNIEVRISPIGASRPNIALVSSQLNLSSVLLDEMYVGFSASTGDVTAFHYVQEWSFSLNDDAEALDIEHIQPIPRQFNTEKHLQPITVALPFVGVIILLVLLFVAYFIIKRKRKFSELLEDWEIEYGPHRFTYKDLFKATKGFHEDNLLGVGGFGRVYKGVLPKSNLEIAVKKISHESQQGMKEFVAEIVSMGRLRHRNLVQLLGYCRRQGELLLVYEFMPNSSLDKFLFGDKKATLNWKQRFQIIKGVASGLLYLHDGWEQVVIHRDIKAANVLLDYELNGKLGDFGLARLYDHGSNPQTTHIVGTLGYLAPELSRTGKATTQTDAYAFGAFLLFTSSSSTSSSSFLPFFPKYYYGDKEFSYPV